MTTISNPHRSNRLLAFIPALAGAALVSAAGVGVVTVGLASTVTLAAGLALVMVAALAAAATGVALVLRRRLREMRYLPDLGRRVVTHHERARVTAVTADGGAVVLHVAADDIQRIVLDEFGAPDQIDTGRMGVSTWRIPRAALRPEQVQQLERLSTDGGPIHVVSDAVVGLAGPVETGWRLNADNGTEIRAGR